MKGEYLFEYHTINVLSEHVEEKPVAHFTLFHQSVHNFSLDETKPAKNYLSKIYPSIEKSGGVQGVQEKPQKCCRRVEIENCKSFK